MLVLSFLLSSPWFLILAALVFLYLLWEGILFRRTLELARRSIKVYTSPSNIKTMVGRRRLVETVVKNEAPVSLRVVGLSLNLPDGVRSETHGVQSLLAPQQEMRIETVLEAEVPGRFKKAWSTVVFEMHSRLFRQHVTFPDNVVMIAEPTAGEARPLIETSGLHDLAVDRVRRGAGTDLAGIRPANPWDDFQRIDWKATARAGRLMTREFYLEREPPIVLLVDNSASMRARRNGGSLLSELVSEVAVLLASTRPSSASPMGLVMFDEREIAAYIEPKSGQKNRQTVLQTLVERAELIHATVPSPPATRPLHAILAGEIETLESESATFGKAKPFYERYHALVSHILPFYRAHTSKHVSRVKREGAFKAFQIVCRLSEPVLVIAVSDGETNLEGLCEGARQASMLNHRVVIAILVRSGRTVSAEWLSDIESTGARVVKCTPEELWSAVNTEILQLTRKRFKEPAVGTLKTQIA
jgi:uncharacterized protein (DUF58 family)